MRVLVKRHCRGPHGHGCRRRGPARREGSGSRAARSAAGAPGQVDGVSWVPPFEGGRGDRPLRVVRTALVVVAAVVLPRLGHALPHRGGTRTVSSPAPSSVRLLARVLTARHRQHRDPPDLLSGRHHRRFVRRAALRISRHRPRPSAAHPVDGARHRGERDGTGVAATSTAFPRSWWLRRERDGRYGDREGHSGERDEKHPHRFEKGDGSRPRRSVRTERWEKDIKRRPRSGY